MTQSDHFALYREIDIALDTTPYNGGITSLESLWMGVPVLTRWGDTAVSRVGLDLVGRLGMPFLATGDSEAYSAKARCLAENLDALQKTRLGLRRRMQASPICDVHRFGRQLEGLYRGMWRRYVEEALGQGQASDSVNAPA
jgi:predicted O-linked N-acetylglucosamine transferase (SPINDLY family)